MITSRIRAAFNSFGATGFKHRLGDCLHGKLNAVLATYSYSRDGGAVGDITLKPIGRDTGSVVVPSGAQIINAFVHVTTALTSGGSATLDFNSQAANDLLAAEAVASFSGNAKIQCVPDIATVGDYVRLTADRTLTMSVNTAALTAGALNLWVFYVHA